MIQDGTNSVNNEQLFIRLYKTVFPAVARYVARCGGIFDEARDVFQDAVIVYYEKHISAGTAPDNEAAYLMGIVKHLWLRRYNENTRYQSLDEMISSLDTVIEDEPQPAINKLLIYLETAGQKCMELLVSFYYDKQPMKNIAGLFGFASEHSATVQKFKCLEKVRETIKNKSLTYEDFIA